MNALVIFDSRFGNTERIARAIAEELGRTYEVRVAAAAELTPLDLEEVDLLVVGAPTQHHRAPSAMRHLLEDVRPGTLAEVEAAAFDTRYHRAEWRTGAASHEIADDLRRLGCELALPPESFFVESREGPLEADELERARAWAREASARAQRTEGDATT